MFSYVKSYISMHVPVWEITVTWLTPSRNPSREAWDSEVGTAATAWPWPLTSQKHIPRPSTLFQVNMEVERVPL